MGFKYTYKGTEHTVSEDTKTLTTRGKYLEDNILIQAEGGLKEISTEAAMDALLVEANNGKYYKYTGTTTTKYHQGSVYKMVCVSGITYDNQGSYGFRADNTILSLDHEVYDDIYKSNNYNLHSTNAIVKVSWEGSEPVEVWINSYAESNYDYTIASKINVSLVPTSYNDGTTQIHTRGFQKNPRNGLNETNWKKYTYTGNSGTNFIYIVYRKDGSTNIADDRGYFVIKKQNACKFEEFPIIDNDTTDITNTNTIDVMHSRNAKVQSDTLIPSNIKSGVNVLGVTGNYVPQVNLQNKTITENGNYTADSGYDGLGTVTVNVSGGGGSGHKIFLLYNQFSNDSDIYFTLNGVDNRVDIQQDSKSWYKFPPMEGINTISIRCDHFGSPFSVSDSWFRIKPVGDSTWHNLTKNEVYTLTSDCEMEFGFGSCLLKGTLITMANGTKKPIEEIQNGDLIYGYNGKAKRVYKCQYGQENYHKNYGIWKIETPYGIKEVRTALKHEFYNVEQGRMAYLVYDSEEVKNPFNIGEHFLDINGNKCKLLSCEIVEEPCIHYTLWCEDNLYYANNFLCGNRHSKVKIVK